MTIRGKQYIRFNEPICSEYSNINVHYLQYQAGLASMIQCAATMVESINLSALTCALETALNVHPLIRECAYVENDKLYTYFGDTPAEVFSDEGTNDRGELCSKTNPYQFRVSIDGATIRLIVYHGLTDGHGMLRFFYTLLYYYLLNIGKDVVADDSITTLETPFDQRELDVLSYVIAKIPSNRPINLTFPDVLHLKTMMRPFGSPVLRTEIHVPLRQVLELSRETRSPISVINSIIAMAARRYVTDDEANNTVPVCMFVPVDMRPLFDNTPAMGNSSSTVALFSPAQFKDIPLHEQAIEIRRQIDRQYTQANFHGHELSRIPDTARIPGRSSELENIALVMSNIGSVKLNESISRHIKSVNFDTMVDFVSMYTGIISYGDDLCLFFDHRFNDRSFLHIIEEVLNEHGIDVTMTDAKEVYTPKLLFEK